MVTFQCDSGDNCHRLNVTHTTLQVVEQPWQDVVEQFYVSKSSPFTNAHHTGNPLESTVETFSFLRDSFHLPEAGLGLEQRIRSMFLRSALYKNSLTCTKFFAKDHCRPNFKLSLR